MADNRMAENEKYKDEIKEIVSIFMELPRTDRAILLNNANAFKTLRIIESQGVS